MFWYILTLKGAGRGTLCPTARRSPAISHRNHLKVSNFLTFPKICWLIGSTVILSISWMAVQKLGRVHQKPMKIFEVNFRKVIFFFQNFDIKTSNSFQIWIWCSEDSFEVLHVSLAQKLTNIKFSPMIFLFLPLVLSTTSWGQSNGLRNLTRVPN